MQRIEKDRKKKLIEIAGVIKLFSIFLCGIIVFNVMGNLYPIIGLKDLARKNYDIFVITVIIIFVAALCYQVWVFSARRSNKEVENEIKNNIETVLFLILYSALVIASGAHASPYKFIYLFIIITTTIQLGMGYGMLVSVVSSAIILAMDLVSIPLVGVNRYFETDIILSGIFILTAWLLGYYVKIEKEYRNSVSGLVSKDELTGLYNHRYFQDSLKAQFDHSRKYNKKFSLILIDIDNFNYYNRMYGYVAGDEVIKSVGNLIRDNIREIDVLARYGGEEYTVILPNTDNNEALNIGERIRKAVENTRFPGEENQPNGKLTVSVGVTTFPDKAKTETEMINSVDDALLKAKYMKKNRVEIYHSIMEELRQDIDSEHMDLVNTLKTLLSIIHAKDNYTYAHTERVVKYSMKIATKMNLTEMELKTVRYGAYLHDIGKIEIPGDLLNKKMPLDESEWDILKKHPEKGIEIIRNVDALIDALPLIKHHHERYDGSGYPSGLSGEEIPLLVRILTIADSFDAMTTNRPYKPAMTLNEAIEEIERCKRSQFDPFIAEVFLEILKEEYAELQEALL